MFVGDGVHAVFQIRSSLTLAQGYLMEAGNSLASGDVGSAGRLADAAKGAARLALGAVERPSFTVASYLPRVRKDIQAIAVLALVSDRAADAGIAVSAAGEEIGLSDEGPLAALYQEGRIDVDALTNVQPFLERAEEELVEAEEALSLVGSVNVDQLSVAIGETRSAVRKALTRARTARVISSLVPKILGAQGPRRYMLAFQALGEARATGGLLGLIGTVEADSGVLELGPVAPVLDIFPEPLKRPVDAPAWFRASYERQAALHQIQQANVSPNFPVVSDVLLEMVEARQGVTLDGVLMMDPFALQGFLTAMEPIRSGLLDTELNGSNAAKVILHDSYLAFETEEEQNEFLADVVQKFWARIQGGTLDPAVLGDSLRAAASSGHLKVFVSDEAAQESVESLGAAGGYPLTEANPQIVFQNNYGVNKVDYFSNRSIVTDIELTEDGNAEVTVSATIENRAPSGPPSLLIGDGSTLAPGMNRSLISFQLPEGAGQVEMRVGSTVRRPQQWAEDEAQVYSTVLNIPPLGSREVKLSYFLSEAFDPRSSEPSFEMTLLPQTTVNPDIISWRVTAPPGYDIMEVLGGQLGGDRAVGDGVLEEPLTIRIDMAR